MSDRDTQRAHFRWQLWVLVLSVAVLATAVWQGMLTDHVLPTVVWVVLMAAATALAGLARAGRLPGRWHISVPVVSLLSALVLAVDVMGLAPAGVLVAIVPGMWLVFEFGRVGTGIAGVALLAVLGESFRANDDLPGSIDAWLTFLPLALGSLALLVGAHQVARGLTAHQEALLAQSQELREAVESSHDRFLFLQAILETADAVIVAYDNEGNLLLDNPRARALAELAVLPTDGNVGPEFFMFCEDRVTPVAADELLNVRMQRGEEVEPSTYWFGPPGQQEAFLLSGKTIHRSDGGRLGFVLVGLDITEILEAVRVREDFLTTVSHELRTPLTSIIGYHELIEEELDPEDAAVARMLHVAQRNASVLLSRVGQLLQASGTDQTAALTRQETDLTALVDTALAKHRIAAHDHGLELRCELQPEVCAEVDAGAIEQVVDNLVSNAIKYTPSGAVTVLLSRAADVVTLGVGDTGVGMAPLEARRAFERFYRSASANRDAIQGIGVGLSVVKSLVEAHGGSVALSSTPGVGTEVVVTLPARSSDAPLGRHTVRRS